MLFTALSVFLPSDEKNARESGLPRGEGRTASESWAAGASGRVSALLTVFLPTSPSSLLLCAVLWCSRQNSCTPARSPRGLGLGIVRRLFSCGAHPGLRAAWRSGARRGLEPASPCAPDPRERSGFVGHRDLANSWAVSAFCCVPLGPGRWHLLQGTPRPGGFLPSGRLRLCAGPGRRPPATPVGLVLPGP